ncbi:MAG: MltA domain-containing protein [Acetobacteraceae bacterium]|nr:MltA domain-containing protein [Acetobacteraceae bacterium]
MAAGRHRDRLIRPPAPAGLLLAALLALLSPGLAAGQAPPGPTLHVSALPGWAEDQHAVALAAFLRGCEALARPPAALEAAAEMPAGLAPLCAEAARLPPQQDAAARRFFETRFAPAPAGRGLMTGYFEPELRGARAPAPGFPAPLRPRPADFVELNPTAPTAAERGIGRRLGDRIEPYPDRAGIEAGALDGVAPPFLWLADPVDKFFLQIQGSGRVVLPDGAVLRVGYAGQNGHPYLPVGRLLIERGAIPRERMSMQAIRAWLAAAPPEEAAALLSANPSYVFFRLIEGLSAEDGPIGTLGAPLTPGRSLAVDRALIPLGLPVWVETRDPLDGRPLRRLMVAQDTGGAIRGPGRGDWFWGWGALAEERAGRMREPAALTVLLPRPPPQETAEAR